MVDIQGREKIVNYINRYKVRKIKLSRGSDVVYMKTIKGDESQSDLIDDFSTWIDDFIDENNFKEYKLELLGYTSRVFAQSCAICATRISTLSNTASGRSQSTSATDLAAP